MTSIFVFNFVMKWFILQIMVLFFSEFLDVKMIYYQHFHESGENLNKLFVYLNDCWMSPRHCPTYACWCRRPSVGQTISAADVSPHILISRHQFAAIAFMCHGVGFDPTIGDVRICDIKCCIWQITLFTWQYTTYSFFSASKLFLTFLYF